MKSTFMTFFIFLSYFVQCQDKGVQAIALYNKAEKAYSSASYEETLDYLRQAETTLGSTNSKLLYLKIQTLNLLYKIDVKKIVELQQAISQFYKVTDQKTFPENKYLEITTIELELTNKIVEEEASYKKAKGSNNFSDYQSFFNGFPGSKHEAELKPKYDELLAQKKVEEQKAANEAWKNENMPSINKYTNKGTRLFIGGGVVAGVGLVWVGACTYLIVSNRNPGYYNSQYYSSAKNFDRGSYMIAPAVAVTATGVLLLALGGRFMHKAVKIKNLGKEKGIDLAYYPSISPMNNTYGAGFTMKF